MKLLRLAYLLAQHPFHLHRELVRRGLALQWIDDFRPFWDQVRPASLPITDYASYTWLEYFFTQRAREKHPQGEHFEDMDWQYARLLSYVKRREMHPLRMLKVAWHLRNAKTVLEFGAGAAPYAHFIATAWPRSQFVGITDIPSILRDYNYHRFFSDPLRPVWNEVHHYPTFALTFSWDAIVCTEVFEHLDDPIQTAEQMMTAAPLIAFDYVDDGSWKRQKTLSLFNSDAMGRAILTGPDKRGLYVWRRR